MGKVVDIGQLIAARREAKQGGQVFVLTNGCFDILHRGHVELLRAARGLGDVLAVALNSDQSVRRLKGESRPVVGQDDRAAVLASLESVDYVAIFEEDTPEGIIAEVVPDVLVKGSDYELDRIVGRATVEEAGGKVVRIPLLAGYSTQRLLVEIAKRYRHLSDDAG